MNIDPADEHHSNRRSVLRQRHEATGISTTGISKGSEDCQARLMLREMKIQPELEMLH
jgi:hypothetical protein